ncbi:MAG: lipid-A-disaccharide synthase [Candidatus Tantalella remota]|nr:lipid-A-disaccharide synthase [Candidatus Tantalella remota]
MSKNILIIAGEPSGDMRAAELVKELTKMMPDARFWGVGGDLSEAEDVELVEHIRNLSIIGIWEAIKKLPKIHTQYKALTENVLKRKPDLAILVDYPGFNLKMARFLSGQSIPVVYYIIPQVWAWGAGRVKTLKKYVDKSLVLFGFEKDFLEARGAAATFTGHPLVDKAADYERTKLPPSSIGTKDKCAIAILPGSRKGEIRSMLPVMLTAADRIAQARKDVRFICAETSSIDKGLYDQIFDEHKTIEVSRVTDNTFRVLDESDFAMVTSGTATLEAALTETPMIVTYRTSLLTAYLSRLVINVNYLGLVNLIAKKEICPELLQEDATAKKISSKILEILGDPSKIDLMKKELQDVRDALGKKGAARTAASAICDILKKSTS